jgi:hypothetical protein
MSEINFHIEEAVNRIGPDSIGDDEPPELRLYSGHDVSILMLHHALQTPAVLQRQTWWPPYASHVIVELLEHRSSLDRVVRLAFDVDDGTDAGVVLSDASLGVVLPLEEFQQLAANLANLQEGARWIGQEHKF